MDKEKLISYLQNEVYGQYRQGEDVNYEIIDKETIKIVVTRGEKTASFTVNYALPDESTLALHGGKAPYFVCMHKLLSVEMGLKAGYGFFFLNSLEVATDDIKREGAFYELYPYTEEPSSQTGVLIAWGWGASKVVDVVKAGLAEAFCLDADMALLTGVSRWGKATAVAGVFDKRFKMVIPACSGAGGLALYSVKSEGKTYDLTMAGGPSDYVYDRNEPLESLQSVDERGWFNDKFLSYKSEEDFPYDQDILPMLCADKDRSYFVVAAWMKEDWVNAPAMWECYLKAKDYYESVGLGNRLFEHFHKEGHAVLDEDMALITKAFDELYY